MPNLFTTEDFRKAWGEDHLVKLSTANSAGIPIPIDAIDFLKDVGLPRHINLFDKISIASDIEFTRVTLGLMKMTDLKVHGGSLPKEWESYWIFGEEKFTGGYGHYCLEALTGRIFHIDLESGYIDLINSSIQQFAASLLIVFEWSKNCVRDRGVWQKEVGRLHYLLQSCDSKALESKHNVWLGIIKSIDHENCREFRLSKHLRGII